MKWLNYVLIFIILCMIPAYGQEVPDQSTTKLIQQINQEHKNTRKFTSDELVRQRQEFFKQMDDRGNYYEETFDKMVTTTTWKLSLLWAGIMFFFVSFNNLMRNHLEKKRFKKLKESLKGEILRDMMINDTRTMQKETTQPIFKSKKGFEVETDELFNPDKAMPTPPSPLYQPKKSWVERRKEKIRANKLNKLKNRLEKNKQILNQIQREEIDIKHSMGINPEQPQPQPQPQPQKAEEPPKSEIHYKTQFEVEY